MWGMDIFIGTWVGPFLQVILVVSLNSVGSDTPMFLNFVISCCLIVLGLRPESPSEAIIVKSLSFKVPSRMSFMSSIANAAIRWTNIAGIKPHVTD